MEARMMTHDYNLSLIFYPQREGRFTVICPELPGCITEGDTLDEATSNIYDVVADFLPEKINASAEDEEALREGLCVQGKLFREVNVTIDASGEVVFPSETFAHAVGVEG
jgi:predicted RNase H-like HicB family nuclease